MSLPFYLSLLSGLIPILGAAILYPLDAYPDLRVTIRRVCVPILIVAVAYLLSDLSFVDPTQNYLATFYAYVTIGVCGYIVASPLLSRNKKMTLMLSSLLGVVISFLAVVPTSFALFPPEPSPTVLHVAGVPSHLIVRTQPLGDALADLRGTRISVSKSLGMAGNFLEWKVTDTSYFWTSKGEDLDPTYVFAPREIEVRYDPDVGALICEGAGEVFNPEKPGRDSVEWRDTIWVGWE